MDDTHDLVATRREIVDDLLAELRRLGPADLVETHGAWILVGAEVYKIKKPLALPYLDFTTFEARERACRNEVRVNRRLAPQTYLGVVPIRRRRNGRATFLAEGSVVEWAVQMRRLEESRRADRLLAGGAFDAPEVDAFAVRLAAFHARAAIAPGGTAAALAHDVGETFSMLKDLGLGDARTLASVEIWQRAWLAKNGPRLEERRARGAIRDGHGDLRLEHVFLRANGTFEVLDALELDERRCADVAADVGLFMLDLGVTRPDLAARFREQYTRAAHDDLDGVLDFYTSQRATLRALLAGDPAEAQRYLALAAPAR